MNTIKVLSTAALLVGFLSVNVSMAETPPPAPTPPWCGYDANAKIYAITPNLSFAERIARMVKNANYAGHQNALSAAAHRCATHCQYLDYKSTSGMPSGTTCAAYLNSYATHCYEAANPPKKATKAAIAADGSACMDGYKLLTTTAWPVDMVLYQSQQELAIQNCDLQPSGTDTICKCRTKYKGLAPNENTTRVFLYGDTGVSSGDYSYLHTYLTTQANNIINKQIKPSCPYYSINTAINPTHFGCPALDTATYTQFTDNLNCQSALAYRVGAPAAP